MPKVGNKEYPYTPAGKAAAKKAAAKAGKPVKMKPSKKGYWSIEVQPLASSAEP